MKRLSSAEKSRRAEVGLKRWRRRLRREPYRYAPEAVRTVAMPKYFSFARRYKATMDAITEIKILGARPFSRAPVIRIDFSGTQSVSAAAMLVLNSEIDRIITHREGRIRFICHKRSRWRKDLARQLVTLGFFSIIRERVSPSVTKKAIREADEFAVVPLIGCNKLNPVRVQRIREELEDVAKILKQGPQLYEAMIEATGNAIDHAYPPSHAFDFEPVKGGTWWAMAVFSGAKKEVRVIVFDQGVGIPSTLHRWGLFERVNEYLAALPGGSGVVKDQARIIEAALAVSRSSKGVGQGRGQGLRDIISPVDDYGTGRVRILSGEGGILYKPGENVELLSLSRHIGGTLIEWSLPVRIES